MAVTILLIHKYYWRPADLTPDDRWVGQLSPQSTLKILLLFYMLKYLWKFDTLFSWSILVSVVGPLVALFMKKEEEFLFLLIEITVKALTAKQLAQIEEVFL